jgi:hypothetical protein
MYELKKIDVWSLVKIIFVLSFCLGLVFGVFYLFIMVFVTQITGSLMGEFDTGVTEVGGFFGVFLVFFIAIFTSVFYTVVSAILAVLYNWISGFTGGLRVGLVLEDVEQSGHLND